MERGELIEEDARNRRQVNIIGRRQFCTFASTSNLESATSGIISETRRLIVVKCMMDFSK